MDFSAIAKQIQRTGTYRDPAQAQLRETRKAVVRTWKRIADALGAQGEIVLAGDVRYFSQSLPPVLTRKELLARQLAKPFEHLAY